MSTPRPYIISPEGLAATEAEEGWRDHVYKDPIGLATWGYGHLVRPGETFPSPATREDGERVLRADFAPCLHAIKTLVKVDLTQNQIDALADWLINVGSGALAVSNLLKRLNAGAYDEVPAELERWCKAKVNGETVTLSLLLARRRREGARWRAGWAPHAMGDEIGATRGLIHAPPSDEEIFAEGSAVLWDLAGAAIEEMRVRED